MSTKQNKHIKYNELYIKRCKLSKAKQRDLFRFFCVKTSGRKAADAVGVHPNTAHLFYRKIRQMLLREFSTTPASGAGGEAPAKMAGVVEVDEAYFGSERIRHRPGKVRQAQRRRDATTENLKRGRGTAKFCVVGAVERNTGRVAFRVLESAGKVELWSFIGDTINERESLIITDGWAAYAAIAADFAGTPGQITHASVNHSRGEYVRRDGGRAIHTNTVENVWRQLKQRLREYYGGFKRHFLEFLAEAAFFFRKKPRQAMREIITKSRSQVSPRAAASLF